MTTFRKLVLAGVIIAITSVCVVYLRCAFYNAKTLVLLQEVGGWYQFRSGPPKVWEWPWYWNMLEKIEVIDPSSHGGHVPRTLPTKPLQFWPPAEQERHRESMREASQEQLVKLLAYAPYLCRLHGLAIRQPIKKFDPNAVIALNGIQQVHLVFETLPDLKALQAVAKKMPDSILVVNGKHIKAD